MEKNLSSCTFFKVIFLIAMQFKRRTYWGDTGWCSDELCWSRTWSVASSGISVDSSVYFLSWKNQHEPTLETTKQLNNKICIFDLFGCFQHSCEIKLWFFMESMEVGVAVPRYRCSYMITQARCFLVDGQGNEGKKTSPTKITLSELQHPKICLRHISHISKKTHKISKTPNLHLMYRL